MKISFILESLSGRGGVERVLRIVANRFAELGHDVSVLLPGQSEEPAWEAKLPSVRYFDPEPQPAIVRLIALANRSIALSAMLQTMPAQDLLIATHVPQTALYARLASGYGTQALIVSWLHNPPERFHEPHFVQYADLHWAISRGIERKVRAIVGEKRPVDWIGNPVETAPHQPVRRSEIPRYVFMGRLERAQKRVDLLLEGLAGLAGDFCLDVYGTGPDEPHLRQLADDLRIAGHVRWHGWQADPWSTVEEATAFVLTSDFEGMPLVIGEALAHGLPVISSDCEDGPRDLITPGETGWLFPPGDALALAHCLDEARRLDTGRWTKMAAAARQTTDAFSIDAVISRMAASLESASTQRAGERS